MVFRALLLQGVIGFETLSRGKADVMTEGAMWRELAPHPQTDPLIREAVHILPDGAHAPAQVDVSFAQLEDAADVSKAGEVGEAEVAMGCSPNCWREHVAILSDMLFMMGECENPIVANPGNPGKKLQGIFSDIQSILGLKVPERWKTPPPHIKMVFDAMYAGQDTMVSLGSFSDSFGSGDTDKVYKYTLELIRNLAGNYGPELYGKQTLIDVVEMINSECNALKKFPHFKTDAIQKMVKNIQDRAEKLRGDITGSSWPDQHPNPEEDPPKWDADQSKWVEAE